MLFFQAGGGYSLSFGDVTAIPEKQDQFKLILIQDAMITRLGKKGWNCEPLSFGGYAPVRVHAIPKGTIDSQKVGHHVPVRLLFGLLLTQSE